MMMPMRLLLSRNRRTSANPSSPRQVDVEQHQCRRVAFDEPVQCDATIDGANPKILAGEIVGEQLPLCCLVLDHDDMGRLVHGLPASELALTFRQD
jgi:hypothetical protein